MRQVYLARLGSGMARRRGVAWASSRFVYVCGVAPGALGKMPERGWPCCEHNDTAMASVWLYGGRVHARAGTQEAEMRLGQWLGSAAQVGEGQA